LFFVKYSNALFGESTVEIFFYNCPSRNTGAVRFQVTFRASIVAVGKTKGIESCDHLII